jgi:2-amino-4-hydroxy-6-hydroxymethyldihydropteridine diphosphokinase
VDRVTAAIAVGSSLGHRECHISFARQQLSTLLDNCRFSCVIETAPIDIVGEQTPFLNAAAAGQTTLTPRELLAALFALEEQRGRRRPHPNAPRTLDLDLILYGDLIVNEPGLLVPHPRFRDRRFVLAPLADVGPQLVDPVTGRTIQELLSDLSRPIEG